MIKGLRAELGKLGNEVQEQKFKDELGRVRGEGNAAGLKEARTRPGRCMSGRKSLRGRLEN